MAETLQFEGHITAEQVRQHPYLYLPFHVPQHASRIQVAYGYTDRVTAPFGNGPGNAVDIGVFDSRGHEFLDPAGFRGWSGTSKPEFFLAPDDATPGYIRGPIFPGEWNILLGVDRIEPEGARYEVRVTITEEAGSRKEEGEPPRSLPARPEVSKERAEHGASPTTRHSAFGTQHSPRWLKGDLHCHTIHSDGLNSVEEIVRNAVDLGLDFLAVTDHNTSTHFEELDRLAAHPEALEGPIVLIPGEEVTTYWGHANMWGLREWIDFRCADEASIDAVRRYVLQKGGLFSVNHPKCVGPPWLFKGWEGYPSMEVWQAMWRFYNWESLERWDALLRKGERVVAVGGSDVHSIPPAEPRHPHGLANPTTWVWVGGTGNLEPGTGDRTILDGIRAGHVFITDAPNETRLVLSADADGDGRFEALMGDTISPSDGRPLRFRVDARGNPDWRLWLIADGVPVDIRPLDKVESTHDFTLDVSGRRYLRAELRGYRGRPERGEVVWAMTNPIWIGGD